MTRDVDPPPALETRVVMALRERGLLRRKRRLWPGAAAAAALLAAFAAGWSLGARGREPVATAPRYVLLLYGAATSGGEVDRVSEYREWARGVRAGGRVTGGERLGDEDIATFGAEPPRTAIRGYFVLEAASDRDAAAIARTHPHVRHGGSVVVRRILPT
jgi:hypothetical protein